MSNLLLQPLPGTLHWALTQNPIDLSGSRFKGKTFTRKKLLQFLSEVIKENPDVLSFIFHKSGNHVHIYVALKGGEMFRIYFFLFTREVYNETLGWYDRATDVQYLTKMLEQETNAVRCDFDTLPEFIY